MISIHEAELDEKINHIKELRKIPGPAVYRIYLLGVKHGLQSIAGDGPFGCNKTEDDQEMRDLIQQLFDDIFGKK